MSNTHHPVSGFTVALLVANGSAIGSAVISVAAAQLDLLITAWALWYVSVIGFITVLGLGTAAVLRAFKRAVPRRRHTRPALPRKSFRPLAHSRYAAVQNIPVALRPIHLEGYRHDNLT